MSSIIDPSGMLMQMNALKLQAGSSLTGIGSVNTNVEPSAVKGGDFASVFKEAIETVNSMQVESADLKTRYELGDRSLNLSDVMIASQKAGISMEATIQVRNKVVEAYKSIMQMQI
jgi:flagellar hook-basal body complex protein FliE